MKKSICLAASLLALNLTPVFGQQPPSTFSQRLAVIQNANQQSEAKAAALTKFNLDFPGGTPKELVAAIEKAMGKPLNVIIPDEDANTKLPPLKLNQVTFGQLSQTLEQGSFKNESIPVIGQFGSSSYQQIQTGYYFRTTDSSATDNSVWFFFVQKAPIKQPIQKVCQFYSLSPVLDRGFTVDDLTTAIQTGWKMTGVTPTPELSYHKETKMLIAFGEPDKLRTIEQVLNALPPKQMGSEIDLPAMNQMLVGLKRQVDQLQKQLAAPVPASTNSLVEKSGK